jgi:hypothetical protein
MLNKGLLNGMFYSHMPAEQQYQYFVLHVIFLLDKKLKKYLHIYSMVILYKADCKRGGCKTITSDQKYGGENFEKL